MPAQNKLQVILEIKDLSSRGLKTFETHTRSAAVDVSRLNRRMKGLTVTAGTLRRTITGMFAGLSTTLIARHMVRVIAGFEQTMAAVRAVTHATDEQFAALSARARELGATTVFSARQAAEGLLALSRAGLSTQQALDAIGGTLTLAVAGELELGEASVVAANTLAQFGLAAGETTRIVDDLVVTANSANTDVRMLAEALKFAGPVAAAMGLSVEETAAALGVLADSGLKATLGGTNLRAMLVRLVAPTKDAMRWLERMSLSINDLDTNAHGVLSVISNLQGGLARLSGPTERAQAAVALFGTRMVAGALAVINHAEKIGKLIDKMHALRGEGQRAASVMQDTLQGSFKAFISAVEEAMLATGDAGLTGSLRGLLDTMTEVIRIMTGNEAAISHASDATKRFVAILKTASVLLAAFVAQRIILGLAAVAMGFQKIAVGIRVVTVALAKNPLGIVAVAAAFAAAELTGLVDWIMSSGQAADDASDSLDKYATKVAAASESVVTPRAPAALPPVALAGAGVEDDKALEAVVKYIDALDREVAMIGLEGEALAVARAQFAQHDAILRLDTADQKDALEAIEKRAIAIYRATQRQAEQTREEQRAQAQAKALAATRKAAQVQLDRMLILAEKESRLLKLSATERRVQIDLERLHLAAQRAGVKLTDEQVAAYERQVRAIEGVNSAMARTAAVGTDGASFLHPHGFLAGWRQAEESARSAGDTMAQVGAGTAAALGSAFRVQFFDPTTAGFKSLAEVARSSLMSIASAFQQLSAELAATALMKFLGNLIGGAVKGATGPVLGLGGNPYPAPTEGIPGFGPAGGGLPSYLLRSGRGNVISGGRLVPFSRGGVVSGPRIFPMSGGAGLVGESGPEAILPLRRGPGGRLGVEAAGPAQQAISYTYAPTINAMDASGVEKVLADDYRRWKSNLARAHQDSDARTVIRGMAR